MDETDIQGLLGLFQSMGVEYRPFNGRCLGQKKAQVRLPFGEQFGGG